VTAACNASVRPLPFRCALIKGIEGTVNTTKLNLRRASGDAYVGQEHAERSFRTQRVWAS